MNKGCMALFFGLIASAPLFCGAEARQGGIECVAHRGYWSAVVPENTVAASSQSAV